MSRTRRIAGTALVVTLAAAAPHAQAQRQAAAAPPSTVIAVYEGTLPCADCSSLRTDLQLSAATASAPVEGTFVMKYTYVGAPKGDVTREETGTWRFMRGTPKDKAAIVYELTIDKTKKKMYWLRASDAELRALDQKRNETKAPPALSLRRMTLAPAPPPGAYRPVGTDEIAIEMVAAYAIGEQRIKIPDLALVKITSAERQIVAGTNYRLCLSLRRGGGVEAAQTVVFQDLNGAFQLSSWTWGPCGRN